MPLSTPSAPVLLADHADMHITAINVPGDQMRIVGATAGEAGR
jgi:hypothetical protein